MWGYRKNCSVYTKVSVVQFENYISVMLANSVNRSAHRHGPPVPQLFHHFSSCSFPLFGLWMTSRNPCAYQFCLRCRWTREMRSQVKRNSSSLHQWAHGNELTYQLPAAQPMSGCHSAYAWWCWVAARSEHTHIRAISTVHTQNLTPRIVCCCHPAEWLTQPLNRRYA